MYRYNLRSVFNLFNFSKKDSLDRGTIADQRDAVLNQVQEIIDNNFQSESIATVITPSTGSQYLSMAMDSVQKQNLEGIKHWIVADGVQNSQAISLQLSAYPKDKVKTIILPENTGGHGMNGHRIYASMPYLVNSKYIFFLDEDNWLESNHISSLIDLMERDDLDWAYSLRNIYTSGEIFVSKDNCESLGHHNTHSGGSPLVDTNCYGFKRSALAKSAYHWYHPRKADRYFFEQIRKTSPRYASTGMYTINYRLKDNSPPFPDFFLVGNQYMNAKYRGNFPWTTLKNDER